MVFIFMCDNIAMKSRLQDKNVHSYLWNGKNKVRKYIFVTTLLVIPHRYSVE